jgi:hypothetical protein
MIGMVLTAEPGWEQSGGAIQTLIEQSVIK